MQLNKIYQDLENKKLEDLSETEVRAITACHIYPSKIERQICYDGFREGIAFSFERLKKPTINEKNDEGEV